MKVKTGVCAATCRLDNVRREKLTMEWKACASPVGSFLLSVFIERKRKNIVSRSSFPYVDSCRNIY